MVMPSHLSMVNGQWSMVNGQWSPEGVMLDARPPLSYLLFVSIQSSLRSVTIADTGPSDSSARRESRIRFVSLSLLCGPWLVSFVRSLCCSCSMSWKLIAVRGQRRQRLFFTYPHRLAVACSRLRVDGCADARRSRACLFQADRVVRHRPVPASASQPSRPIACPGTLGRY